MNGIFNRTELLLGTDAMESLRRARVAVFGIGGVGSWCAEALGRTGVGHLNIVDGDTVSETNINRQLIATTSTVGRAKVDVMSERLRDINPDIDVCAVRDVFTPENADKWGLGDYDVVVDAIDSVAAKSALILEVAAQRNTHLVSSMGAALKSDPTRIEVAEFWKVYGCPLARALRDRFKKSGVKPRRKFKCVYSPELLANRGEVAVERTTNGLKRGNGTVVYATATFGLVLAQLTIDAILSCQRRG